MNSWEITYPDGMVKFVDFFRAKNFQYEVYDKVVKDYLEEHSKISVDKICSLGSGTGRHEVQLAKMGYSIIGVERNQESLPILNALFAKEGISSIEVIEADFLNEEALKAKLTGYQFDCILLLFIPLSIEDVKKVVCLFEPYIKVGGVILTNQFFGYDDGFVPNCTLSECDFADNPFQERSTTSEFCVRLNTFKYGDMIIDWTAVYIYYDNNHCLQMSRDRDIIEVLGHDTYVETLRMANGSSMELLPVREVTECSLEMNMPKTSDYIVAWRKTDAQI
ncbi:class I SAM-dependent methyltransferase [Dehalobacter restrictus]|uniref:class I SAM-dependent methyltransferase n=1 Tax=Dehalobacter restrictus TaxID=55583 RepID=UPI00338F01B4